MSTQDPEWLALPPLLGDLRQSPEEWRNISFLHLALAAVVQSQACLSPFYWLLLFRPNHFFTWLPYSFLSFCLTLPFMVFSLTAVKVREWEGRPGLWEGLVRVASPRSNTFLFWSLSPQLRHCLGSRPGCYGNSKILRKLWLPFPRGRCPPFLAGPLPITLTCPRQLAPCLYLDGFTPSPLAPSLL